jgi:hypothetical protein
VSTEDEVRAKFELLKHHLDGRLHRIWAAAEAAAIGRGGRMLVSAATGISLARITAGLRVLRGRPPRRCAPTGRRRGGQFWEDRDPTLVSDLEQLIEDEVAGDPMTERTWVRASVRRLRDRLRAIGHPVGHCTVHRLLRKLGFTLRANRKRRGGSRQPGRDEQFEYITSQRKQFGQSGLPVISVDTKQKVSIGEFLRPGKTWCKTAAEVSEYDFTSLAAYRAVPYGIYDLVRNAGHVVIGTSNDTPSFAVSAIAAWWEQAGKEAYPEARELLILADSGGANGFRGRAWKLNLQEKLCGQHGLTVTVCHYPPGCSKWNPVERRLFSQISINWAGKPLKTLDMMLGYIRGTTTRTGLTVTADLDEAVYERGQRVAEEDVKRLSLTPHATCPDWNYTLSPRVKRPTASPHNAGSKPAQR